MRFLRRSLTGLFLLGLTLGLLVVAGRTVIDAVGERLGAEPRGFPARERVVSVDTVPYLPETIVPTLSTFGELRAARELDLRASATGTVLSLSDAFVEGGRVAAGATLLTLDPTEADAARDRVRADLADAEAATRDADRALTLARDELAAAVRQAELREGALSRQRDLQDRGIGTAPEIEAAELAASAADQAVLARRQAVASAEAQIDRAASTLARAELDLAQAMRDRADTVVTAPFAGVLAQVSVATGARVTANETLARLIDPATLEVTFRLSTAQYARLAQEGGVIGAPVSVALDADVTATGTVTRESAEVGEGQTGRLIFARLEDTGGLRPGDFVTVALTEPPLAGVARLPASALGPDGTVLTLAGDDRLRADPVTLLRRQGDDVIVRADALDGAQVVATRTPLLGAGIKVALIGAAPDDGSADAAPGAGPDAALIPLDPERRARLVAFVEGSDRMPEARRARLLAQLSEPEVPQDVVAEIEGRMEG